MILELLGVRHGVVVLTNADTIDTDQLDTAQLVIGERLSRSSLRDAAIVLCDSVSGRGLDDVRVALDAALGSAPPAPDADRPRLWVDRVFAPRGAGTVVTGTLVGGAVAVGDVLEIGETGAPVRVRGIETAHRHVDRAAPGTRVALNLAGVERSTLQRGDALVRSGQWTATSVVDVAVTGAPGEQLRGRARLQAYAGSGEHEVWCQVLDDAGDLARLRFLTPIPLAPGDRVVLRDAGRECTVAGAEVARRRAERRGARRAVAPPAAGRGAAARPRRAGAGRRHPAPHRPGRAGRRRARRVDGRVGSRGAHRRVTRRPGVAARPSRTGSPGGAGDARHRPGHAGEHAGDGRRRPPSDGGRRRGARRRARHRARGHAVADRRVTRSRRAARRARRVSVLATQPVHGRSRPRARRCARPPRHPRRHRWCRLHAIGRRPRTRVGARAPGGARHDDRGRRAATGSPARGSTSSHCSSTSTARASPAAAATCASPAPRVSCSWCRGGPAARFR